MSREDDKGLPVSPWPLLAVALVAAGVLVKNVPLESARPSSDDLTAARPVGTQDVEARLWQDPLAVRAAAVPNGTDVRKRHKFADEDPTHKPDSLVTQVELARGTTGFELVGAMVVGGTHGEESEARRRTRYAIIQGLQARGWHPDDPSHIGYVWFDSRRDPNDPRASLPEIVPYEWFARHEAVSSPRLLVLWIEEDALGEKPVLALHRLARAVLCAGYFEGERDPASGAFDTKDCGQRAALTNFAIVGPAASSTLRAIHREIQDRANEALPPYSDTVNLAFFSSGATIANARLEGIGYGGNTSRKSFDKRALEYGVTLRRLTTTDDILARELADELVVLRGLASFKPYCGTLVVVSEADTAYGQAIGDDVTQAVADKCDGEEARPLPAIRKQYFRGLDGLLPRARAKENGDSGDGREVSKRGKDELELRAAPKDRADGRSQFDYLRRLATELVERDTEERQQGRPGIRAVGILGNDVYDKLLILQALHGRLPNAVFFTTDLDARLVHPDQAPWARNLVVVSGYGLSLRDEFQGKAPPFRDSYQTGTYFSTLVALDPKLQAAFDHLASDETPTSTDTGTGGSAPEHQPRTLGEQWFESGQRFEIGRSRPVELTRGDERRRPKGTRQSRDDTGCADTEPAACKLVAQDANQSGVSGFITALNSKLRELAVALAAGLAFFGLTSRTL